MPSSTTPKRQHAFLEAYARCGVVTEAAETVGIVREQHYRWMQDDPDYKTRFEQAQARAADSLESELFRRVREGVEEVVTEDDGKQRVTRKFSDTLLIFALKGQKPDRYREQWKGELQHTGALAVSSGPDLSKLSHEQLVQLKQLALAAAADAQALIGSGSDSEGGDEESADENSDVLP